MKAKSTSRADDFINLFYLLVYLYKMDLPWLDYLICMPNDSIKTTFKMIFSMKKEFDLVQLSSGMPEGFTKIASII
jgi:hypothetical protein